MFYRTDIYNVAKALLSIEPMSPKKLQKLCYYYFAWHYVLKKEQPFDNNFEAWIHGPVDRGLYNEYKSFGWNEIPKEDKANIPEDVLEFAENVYGAYGHLDGDELEYITHREDPWKVTRGSLPEHEPSTNKIDAQLIADYYSRKLENAQIE